MTLQKKNSPEYFAVAVSEPNGPDDLVPTEPLTGIGPDRTMNNFTEEDFEVVCAEMAAGKNIREIFDKDGRPAYKAFSMWLSKNPAEKARWEDAKEMKAMVMLAESVDIVDGKMDDTRSEENPNGKDPSTLNGVLIQSRDLRARTRLAVANALLRRAEDKNQNVNNQVGVIIGWGNQPPKPST